MIMINAGQEGARARWVIMAFWRSRPWSVTVTDARGLILWEVSMDGVSSAAGQQIDAAHGRAGG